MIQYKDRVVDINNNYLRFFGNMSSQEVDLDKMREGGIQLQQKLDSLIEEESQRGNDDIKVLPDLLDLKVLSDANRFTDGIREVVSMAVALSDNTRALVVLGFNNPNSYADFNVASAQISQIAKKVAFNLYHNLVNAIKTDTTVDDLVIDMVLAAIEDQIAERMNFPRFCEKNGIALTEETEDKVRMAYDSRYNEWVSTEAERILAEVVSKPMENVLIDPSGFEDVREKLYELCPPEANEWIGSLTPDAIYSGEVFEKLLKEYKLDRESLTQFAAAVERFMSENQTAQSVQLGQGQNVNPFYSTNMASILLHTMIMASSELWDVNDTEISETTEYIVDLFRAELENVTTIEFDETTPYKMLSVIANINPLLVSRSAVTRASHQDYILAQGAITMMINQELMEIAKHERAEYVHDQDAWHPNGQD